MAMNALYTVALKQLEKGESFRKQLIEIYQVKNSPTARKRAKTLNVILEKYESEFALDQDRNTLEELKTKVDNFNEELREFIEKCKFLLAVHKKNNNQ